MLMKRFHGRELLGQPVKNDAHDYDFIGITEPPKWQGHNNKHVIK